MQAMAKSNEILKVSEGGLERQIREQEAAREAVAKGDPPAKSGAEAPSPATPGGRAKSSDRPAPELDLESPGWSREKKALVVWLALLAILAAVVASRFHTATGRGFTPSGGRASVDSAYVSGFGFAA